MYTNAFKVIPYYCIAHPYCARFSLRVYERVHVQNVRDFPQTKLDHGINSSFLCLMKNIFEEEKKFDSRT